MFRDSAQLPEKHSHSKPKHSCCVTYSTENGMKHCKRKQPNFSATFNQANIEAVSS